jgi:hypothetical protein
VRRGEKPVNVPAGETVDDTLLVTSSSSVDIDGTVNGDLIALAREVRVKGTIKGNLISLAQRTEIDGAVEGSVLGAGSLVEVRGNIMRNLYGAAGSVVVAENARIDGNATILVGDATLEGSVAKDFRAYTTRGLGLGRPRFSSGISVEVEGGAAIQVLRHAHIGRSLYVRVDQRQSAMIDPAATIGGQTDIDVAPIPPSRYATASFYVWQTIWLAAAFLIGVILLWAVPGLAGIRLNSAGDLLLSGGLGLAMIVVPPVAAVIACLTLVGLPLGFMTAGLWLVTLYLAKIIIAAFLGRSLLAGTGSAPSSMPLSLLVGLVAVFLAINLPYVGGVIDFLLVALGSGALAMRIYQMTLDKNPSGSVAKLPA